MSKDGKKALKIVGYTMLMVAAQVMATVAESKISTTMQQPRTRKN